MTEAQQLGQRTAAGRFPFRPQYSSRHRLLFRTGRRRPLAARRSGGTARTGGPARGRRAVLGVAAAAALRGAATAAALRSVPSGARARAAHIHARTGTLTALPNARTRFTANRSARGHADANRYAWPMMTAYDRGRGRLAGHKLMHPLFALDVD